MAKILYLSCHSILEHDEVKLLTEMGHQVFSFGSYQNPKAPHDEKRPPIKGFYDDHLQAVAIQCSKENLHQELIDWADIIIVMHRPDWVLNNWDKMKNKRVIWRTIGQSEPSIEAQMAAPRSQGLQIIRYSPMEREIPGFAGEDKLIRFFKDESEFNNYNGGIRSVVTVAQSMKKRGAFCGFDIFDKVTQNIPRVIYGPDNEDSGMSGGLLTYDELKKVYRDNRVYFYTGTYPASYTLNFIEAMMTGIPIVAIGSKLADMALYPMKIYEVDKIIQNGVNGFVSDNLDELRSYVDMLLSDHPKAMEIGWKGRLTAIDLFGKKVKNDWRSFI